MAMIWSNTDKLAYHKKGYRFNVEVKAEWRSREFFQAVHWCETNVLWDDFTYYDQMFWFKNKNDAIMFALTQNYHETQS